MLPLFPTSQIHLKADVLRYSSLPLPPHPPVTTFQENLEPIKAEKRSHLPLSHLDRHRFSRQARMRQFAARHGEKNYHISIQQTRLGVRIHRGKVWCITSAPSHAEPLSPPFPGVSTDGSDISAETFCKTELRGWSAGPPSKCLHLLQSGATRPGKCLPATFRIYFHKRGGGSPARFSFKVGSAYGLDSATAA